MSEKMRRILMVVLGVVFIVSAVVFGRSFLEYRKGDQIYESAKEFVVEADTPVLEDEVIPVEEELPPGMRTFENIDFSSMQTVNEDVIGWIQIYDTPVDYPLLDADDNQYYLNHTYDRQWSSYGSIFLEARNHPDLSEQHLVIYGHNMKNGSMFASLLDYKNQEYYEKNDTITICLPDRDLKYQVFSAYTAHVDSPTYYISVTDESVYQEMVNHMKENSVITSDITPKDGEQVLTLSTCTPEGAKKYRFVVNAVLMENE